MSTTNPSHEQLELPFDATPLATGHAFDSVQQPGAQILQFPATLDRPRAKANQRQSVDAELLGRIVDRVRFF